MNGFANTILTLLLSWLRVLISNIWSALSGEGASLLYQFLANNWKILVGIVCIGGFVVDRIIYLIRWRPYYVWQSKLHRLRHPDHDPQESKREEAAPQWQEVAEPEAPYWQETPAEQAVPAAPASYAPTPYAQPAPGYDPTAFSPAAPTAIYAQPASRYAPAVQNPAAAGYVPYAQPYEPPQDIDLVFDDETAVWDEADQQVQPQNPAQGMDSSFGMPKPEPLNYLRDMHAGFAPPVPPEQMYASAPSASSPEPVFEPEPVHPGLNNEALRQSFGLAPPGDLSDAAPEPAPRVSAFRPFTQQRDESECGSEKPLNPFVRFAKKARDLVGVEDEDHRPTIRDLQSTVDVSQAFRDPVYPVPRNEQGGEE